MQTQKLSSLMRHLLLPLLAIMLYFNPHTQDRKPWHFPCLRFVASDLITSFLVLNQRCSSTFPRRTKPSTTCLGSFCPCREESEKLIEEKNTVIQEDKKQKQKQEKREVIFYLETSV